MLWNRNRGGGSTAAVEAKSEKARKLSPKDIAAQQIATLEPGGEVVFKLGEIYLKPFVAIVGNAEYPTRGKRFNVFQDTKDSDGKPAGKRAKFWDTNNAAEIADWIVSREGKRVEA